VLTCLKKVIEIRVLLLAVPPVIERHQNEYTVVQERDVTLQCRVSGLPTPVVRWFKDNQTISPDDIHYRILRSNYLAIPIVRCVKITPPTWPYHLSGAMTAVAN